MTMPFDHRRLSIAILPIAIASVVVVAGALSSVASLSHVVSQKDKRFGPSNISLRSGDFITIVNDDGNFVHQAYIETGNFAYDSGDIEPGASATIWFPRDGDFTVLCGIHPTMRLAVHVQG